MPHGSVSVMDKGWWRIITCSVWAFSPPDRSGQRCYPPRWDDVLTPWDEFHSQRPCAPVNIWISSMVIVFLASCPHQLWELAEVCFLQRVNFLVVFAFGLKYSTVWTLPQLLGYLRERRIHLSDCWKRIQELRHLEARIYWELGALSLSSTREGHLPAQK